MQVEGRFFGFTIVMLTFGMLLALMIIGSALFIPIAWALVFALMALPVAKYFEKKKFKRPTASLIATLAIIILMALIMYFLIREATVILSSQDNLFDNLTKQLMGYITELENKFNIPITSQLNVDNKMSNVVTLAADQVASLGKNLVTITLIPMYMFFIINYRGLLLKFIDKRYQGIEQDQVMGFVVNAQQSIENYLKGTLILTLVAAAMTFVILLIFGIRFAFFFAMFISILNLIPYIGNLIAIIVTLLFVYATKDSITTTVFVFISLYISNLIQENFLRPKLIGDKMEMNAGIVFTAVIIGGMIWGFSGMILFIPFVGIVKAFIDSNPRWKSFSVFFDSE
jgi:predicted PurR-regulated permease PerM